jgi:hypothetical protein
MQPVLYPLSRLDTIPVAHDLRIAKDLEHWLGIQFVEVAKR